MNGYVVGGYVVSIGSLVTYGCSIAGRERAVRRRLGRSAAVGGAQETSPLEDLLAGTEPEAEWSAPPTEPT